MKKFLDKYDTMIFDMDGVVTSEQGYWYAAALTVYEYLYGKDRFGNDTLDGKYLSDNVEKIRKEIFLDDKLIELFKGKGVNSNWDLGYITVLISLITDSRDMETVYEYAENIDDDIISAYDMLAKKAAKKNGALFEEYKRNGKLWTDMRDTLQEWYFGDERFTQIYGRKPYLCGKSGEYKNEKPIIPLEELKELLTELKKTKRLCVATGRQRLEIVPLLEEWGVLDLFDENGICDYNFVISGEAETDATLTKPHPYMFLKALYGLDYPNSDIICGNYDKTKLKKTLVVGDAGADILAAKAMESDFCAVLTGVSGQAGKAYFKQQNAEYILDSIRDMKEDS